MNRLRSRLVLAFLLATLAPLGISLWITTSLLDHSLSLSTTSEVEELSAALERTAREFYQQSRDMLRSDVEAGRAVARKFLLTRRAEWPPDLVVFWESGEQRRFQAASMDNQLHYLVRMPEGVARYSRQLGSMRMGEVSGLLAKARTRVEKSRTRDIRRGFLTTLSLLAATISALSIAVIIFFANRISRPVQKLTDALQRLASGDFGARVETTGRRDEIGTALEAFNHMAEQLQQSRERLVMLTRLSSWQALGRKMAHEVKNSLTPIRLTVEEMAARQRNAAPESRAFFDQAAQIIVDEVNRLERRVRAFSDLAAEPPVNSGELDVNAICEERAGFLRSAHPDVLYQLRLAPGKPMARGDEDLVRGILTNLMENAAEAAGPGGVVLCRTALANGGVLMEVHDSGPGLSLHARETLFQPTISFKKTGMGLGLSIARKSALLSGGDICTIDGELGGAAFRVTLPRDPSPKEQESEDKWAHHAS